ncbi:hypothetical protein PV05_05714 [Exophiala xenobiotica]|uniref:Uncharacterized protein n=1 Tax=Exophiala xenobiotica TaxID=348802 RepID=A0A0D2BXG9_9EURO|nr:uncharacterized protein PV05_05714 [Exophiala xenobiotica]KIW57116.1 hypothetical protein PV05_05714 [Exophiala xenobiotica]
MACISSSLLNRGEHIEKMVERRLLILEGYHSKELTSHDYDSMKALMTSLLFEPAHCRPCCGRGAIQDHVSSNRLLKVRPRDSQLSTKHYAVIERREQLKVFESQCSMRAGLGKGKAVRGMGFAEGVVPFPCFGWTPARGLHNSISNRS